jgi:two-component system CheB/CheR fusion protein
MPYRTLDNMIDGVVITFTDITVIKQLEAQLRLRGEQP